MPESDLNLLTDAARKAGDIALKYWKQDPKVWEKADDAGPVTEADLAINEMLEMVLRTARPDYGWLSEESSDDSGRLSTRRQFIIDPIDGTRAFIKGEPSFSHALAIAEDGQIIAGVVLQPSTNQMYSAQKGQGAWKNGDRIRAVDQASPKPDLLSARPNFAATRWKGAVPDVKLHFRSSLALRMALAAEGRFEGMLTLRDSWEWDIAAGALICSEAGLTVTDRKGSALRFNNAVPMTKGALALPADLHAEYIAKLA